MFRDNYKIESFVIDNSILTDRIWKHFKSKVTDKNDRLMFKYLYATVGVVTTNLVDDILNGDLGLDTIVYKPDINKLSIELNSLGINIVDIVESETYKEAYSITKDIILSHISRDIDMYLRDSITNVEIVGPNVTISIHHLVPSDLSDSIHGI